MEAAKFMLEKITERMKEVQEKQELVLQMFHKSPLTRPADLQALVTDSIARSQELQYVLGIIKTYIKEKAKKPEIGNIEKCFQEEMINEIVEEEEDFFDGY